MTLTTDQLISCGGKLWTADSGEQRVYFEVSPEMLGWDIHHYGTGRVSGARHNGADVSNSRATAALNRLSGAKFWFDVARDGFFARGLEGAEGATLKSAILARLGQQEIRS